MNYFWVALGSAVGGMGRYAVSGLGVRFISETFPWGTLAVNVLGSLIIGALAVILPVDTRLLTEAERELLMVGFCGGFTTFSSFSLEVMNLARNGDWATASAYAVGSVVVCLAAVAIGYFGTLALAR